MDEEKKDVGINDSKKEIEKPVEKKAPVSNKSNDPTLTDKMRENPWVVSTIVLAIVTIILLVGNFSGSVTGASVAKASDVEAKVLDFVNSQVDEPVSIVDTTMQNGLYQVVVLYQGQQVPIYVTADGENLVQGVTPFSLIMQDAADSSGTQTQQTNVPKSDKPKVELFVMSMCPYGTQAEKGLLPVLNLLGDKIDFELKFVSYAMHGKNEVDENTVQYCIEKNQPDKLYDYLKCYLDDSDPAHWKACRNEVGVNEGQLSSCISATDSEFKITELFNDQSTWSGGRYPQYNVDKADTTKYGVSGSPTLIINGVQSGSGRDSASYLNAICAAFNTAPEECSTELLSQAPAPGFGWETTQVASNTAAQCG